MTRLTPLVFKNNSMKNKELDWLMRMIKGYKGNKASSELKFDRTIKMCKISTI